MHTSTSRWLLLLGLLPPAGAHAQASLLAVNHPQATDHPRANQAGAQSLESALQALKAAYGVSFFYNSRLVEGKLLAKSLPAFGSLEEALRYVLTPNQLQYEKLPGNVYLIVPQPAAPNAAAASSVPKSQPIAARRAAAEVPVSGRVTQADGSPVPGATVIVKGTTQGASTNEEGIFSLNVPEGSTLVFSSVGFLKKEIAVSGPTTGLNVRLDEDLQAIGEVVVVGYGTQRREDVTGAIASISETEIKTQPVTSFDQAIQGRAAGVQVTQSSGAPGGAVTVQVRGIGTVNNATPLYVIDGVPFNIDGDGSNGNVLNTFNPNDIASIDVLKDASATAIYGARGANGVVIITTKRGQAGKTKINFDAYYGVQKVGQQVELLDAAQFAELSNELLVAGGQQPNDAAVVGAAATSPDYSNPAALGRGTDWLAEIFRPARIQNYNLGLSGGNEKTQFALSGGVFQQDGTIIGSDFRRYSLRLNLDHKLSERVKIGNSLALSRTEQRIVTTDEDTQSGLVFLAMNQLPTLPVYRNGTFAGPEGRIQFVGDRSNPVGRAKTLDNHLYRNRLIGNVFGELEVLQGLRFRTNLGLDAVFRENSFFEPSYRWGSVAHPLADVAQSTSQNLIWLWENTLTYNRTFAGKHALTALLGTAAQNSQARYLSAGDRAYPYNSLQSLDQGSNTYSAGSGEFGWSLLSYMGRVNYAYADKYLFTGTVRLDGSSRFGPENKWGVFPSGSAAWRISQEPFMQNLRQVSDLKLRASYGWTGNQNIGLYGFATQLSGTQRYAQGNAVVPGVVPTVLPNPGVHWETVKQADLGLDLGVLDNRVVLTADVYDKHTTDMLLGPPVTPSSGYLGASDVNAGQVSNRGLELGLNTRNLTGDFTWNTNFNISFVQNKVLDLAKGSPLSGGYILTQATTRTAEGHPIGAFFGYVTDGIFQTPEEVRVHATQQPGTAPGDIRYRDLNQDGIITDADRTFIGSPLPKFTAGLTNTFSYKNFDLSVFFYGVYGNKLFNANRVFTEAMAGAANQTTRVLDRWRSVDQPGDGQTPRAVYGDPNTNSRVSDRYLEDGSFLRLKNLTVGYNFPAAWLAPLRMQTLRLYVTGQNLLTFTKYSGFDPEVGPFGGNQSQTGVDNGTYPVSRTMTVGVNVGF